MTPKPRSFPVPAEYMSLHEYLETRYADTVVLTFGQIEALLGFALPESARREPEWWADGDADDTPSAQARSWTQAHRTATANLLAHTVSFARSTT